MIKQKNNKGFSLIEIIIAIAILAIIVLPFLNSFVSSARLNERARKQLRATEAARNIMEGLKGYSIAELAKEFNYDVTDLFLIPDVMRDASFSYYEVNIGENVMPVATGNGSSRYDAVTGDYVFFKNTEDVYNYFIKGIKSDKLTANALITLKGKTEGEAAPVLNKAIYDISPIDTEVDAVIGNAAKSTEVSAAAAAQSIFANDPAYSGGMTAIDADKISRRIVIDINDDGSDVAIINWKIEYIYGGASTVTDLKTEGVENIGKGLRSVYLFYDPWGRNKDSIVIKNNKNKEVNVYLVKRKINPEPFDYKAEIKLIENTGKPKSTAKLFTNIAASEGIYSFGNKGNESITPYGKTAISLSEELVDKRDVGDEHAQKRFYEVEVKIFDKEITGADLKTANPLVTLTGGMAN